MPAISAAAGAVTVVVASVLHRRGLRRALLALVICLPLLAGCYLLVRRSPLSTVEHVRVSGVHGSEAGAIEAALAAAARHMSTLGVNDAALREAVSSYPVVAAVSARPSFPHSLQIVVSEQLPVASVNVGGQVTAVAADGAVLGTGLLSSTLPSIGGDYLSSRGRVMSSGLLAALGVLGAEPAPLARLTGKVFTGPYGLTVQMRNGVQLYFGDATRPHAKWLALERVLLDSSSAGASAIDLRLPERPAAEFAASTPAASTPKSSGSGVTGGSLSANSEATIASLAAALSEGGHGTIATPTTTTASPAAPSETPASSSGSETHEEHASEPSAAESEPSG